MRILSRLARRRKIAYFLEPLPKDARILEIGSGPGWVGEYLRGNGWNDYMSLDLIGPADVVGDIRHWQDLGLERASFDVIIAFEVVEHVDCFEVCHALLKDHGRLLLTTPVPHMDWLLTMLEWAGLNQTRTSPHNHLVYLKRVSWSGPKQVTTIAGLSQWAVFTKQDRHDG